MQVRDALAKEAAAFCVCVCVCVYRFGYTQLPDMCVLLHFPPRGIQLVV